MQKMRVAAWFVFVVRRAVEICVGRLFLSLKRIRDPGHENFMRLTKQRFFVENGTSQSYVFIDFFITHTRNLYERNQTICSKKNNMSLKRMQSRRIRMLIL